ncbi:DUF1643 domain-containing protein [Occultella glacieicola]|uniref:DUF1643 domain-containing protein n=1 Tax=Occultella glacieicola TaxID=2518684 RepID=UPI001F41055C|nr:DUF1643 domain-containing protein [Occultella glacieicola]
MLLNPPSASSGARSRGAVRRAAGVLGFDGYEVANLFADPTPTVVELNLLSAHEMSWPELQQRLSEQLRAAHGVLAAWGVAGASGNFRRARGERAAWLIEEAERRGHRHFWTVGGEPRHPSRWHQYVADKHGRATGGTFEERLVQVLTLQPLGSVEA